MFERIKGLQHVTLVAGHACQNMTSGIRKEMDSLGEVNVPDRISIERLLIFYGSGRGLPLESAFDRRIADGMDPQIDTIAQRRPHTWAHTNDPFEHVRLLRFRRRAYRVGLYMAAPATDRPILLPLLAPGFWWACSRS